MIDPTEAAALENVRRLLDDYRRTARAVEEQRAAQVSRAAEVLPPIRRVGIVGAGQMGTAIAAAHLRHCWPTLLVDLAEDALVRARQSVLAELAEDLPHRQAERLAANLITMSVDVERLAECDLVIESIPESLPIKQQLYARIERHLAPTAVLATNTSVIPVTRLAMPLSNPERFCGLHFCHPVRRRPLVEVACGAKTSDHTAAVVWDHARALGFMPVQVADTPGFVVNRLLMAYLAEALVLLEEGMPAAEIDEAMVEFGMPLGPLEMLDDIGLDTALRAGWQLSNGTRTRQAGTMLLVYMVKSGQVGKKSGAGIYLYPARTPNTGIEYIVRKICYDERSGKPLAASPPRSDCRPSDIAPRLLMPMVEQARCLWKEGHVQDVSDIDLAVLFGLGFPAFRGGLLWWADHWGAGRLMAAGVRSTEVISASQFGKIAIC